MLVTVEAAAESVVPHSSQHAYDNMAVWLPVMSVAFFIMMRRRRQVAGTAILVAGTLGLAGIVVHALTPPAGADGSVTQPPLYASVGSPSPSSEAVPIDPGTFPRIACDGFVGGTSGGPMLVPWPGGWAVIGVIGGYHTGGNTPQISYSAYFDTATGAKQRAESYERIAAALELPPPEILFLSDVTAELDAAQLAGMQTALCVRPGSKPSSSPHPVIQTFDQVFS